MVINCSTTETNQSLCLPLHVSGILGILTLQVKGKAVHGRVLQHEQFYPLCVYIPENHNEKSYSTLGIGSKKQLGTCKQGLHYDMTFRHHLFRNRPNKLAIYGKRLRKFCCLDLFERDCPIILLYFMDFVQARKKRLILDIKYTNHSNLSEYSKQTHVRMRIKE